MKTSQLNPKKIKHSAVLIALCSPLIALSALFYFCEKYNKKVRYDGIPSEQKMTLIKKEIVERSKINDTWEGLASSHCSKLSFDTDGDTNTTEIIAYSKPYDGNEEIRFLKVGTQKTLKGWDNSLPTEYRGVEPLEWHFKRQQAKKLASRDR